MTVLKGVIQGMGGFHPATLGIGLASIMILVIFKRKRPNFPAPIIVVTASTLVVYFFRPRSIGCQKLWAMFRRVCHPFSIPEWSVESLEVLFPAALTILFIGFMESISIAEWVAAREKYKIDSNRETGRLGLANVTASFFSAYPVTGGFFSDGRQLSGGGQNRTCITHHAQRSFS